MAATSRVRLLTSAIFYGTGEDKDTEKKYKFAKLYNLFNLEQTGIELPVVEVRQTKLKRPYEIPEALKVKLDCHSHYNPCTTCYHTVKMPLPGQFETDDAHQSTLYHECIHATGHSKRLNRELGR